MLRIGFIASEYNPFHNGHKYHIEKTKQLGADAVVCVMSGNFVQRGDIAVAEKHVRAKTALMSGADLVVELPLKYAVSTASYFAEGFVKTAAATGLEGFISCGATADKSSLETICDYCFSEDAELFAAEKIAEGINYPRAKAIYLKNTLGAEYSEMFAEPNNILALEYINAKRKFAPDFDFYTVSRIGAAHDSEKTSGSFSSASNLRGLIYSAENINYLSEQIREFTPEKVADLLVEEFAEGRFVSSVQKFNAVSMSRLLCIDSDFLNRINNVNGGLDNRILKNIRICSSISEIADKTKSKIHTHSRIRQILLNAVLGITRDDLLADPSYIRVLGFNDNGRKVLNLMRNTAKLPVISNLSEADTSNSAVSRDVNNDYIAGKLFSLCAEKPIHGNPEYDIPPIYYR